MTGVPPFQELLVLHENGTVSETNTTLHANSANPANPQFNFNGSDGYGAWRTGRHDTVALRFVKLVFDGDMNEHVGYLVVDATAAIDGGVFTGQASDVNMLMGTDLNNPDFVIPFGSSDSFGHRITLLSGR